MYRKIVFIFFSMIPNISNEQKSSVLLLFAVLSFCSTVKYRPFILRELNMLEMQSNLTALITIFAGLIYVLEGGDFLQICIFLLIFIINTIFAVKWFLSVGDLFLYSYETKIFRMCPCFIKNIYIFRKTIADTTTSLNLTQLKFIMKNLHSICQI